MARASIVAALVALFPFALEAQEDNILPVDVQVPETLVVGEAQPFVTVTASAPLKAVKVTVRRAGWQRQFAAPSLGAGQSKTFRWTERPGFYEYTVVVQAKNGAVTARQDFTMGLSYLPAIQLRLDKRQVSIAKRQLTLQLNQPAERVEISIRDERGAEITHATESFDGAAPGSPLVARWDEIDQTIGSIQVNAYSTAGFWAGAEITPWSVTIPHEDVVFETDRWEVRASEAHKLDAAVVLIQQALKQHGSDLPVELYVGGFTDTVGSVPHNRELSQKRARAIAEYFAAHQVSVPIRYRGYGEEALGVPTPDETAEARNRRATYVLAPQPPSLSKTVAWGGWQALRSR
jgi:outer membrane protein OmpA-like peptidoglycan-associated protein